MKWIETQKWIDTQKWIIPKFVKFEIIKTSQHEIRAVTEDGRLIGGRVDYGIFEVDPVTDNKIMLFTHDRAMTSPILLTRSGHLIATYLYGNTLKFMRSTDTTFTNFTTVHDIGVISALDHSMAENEEGVILYGDYVLDAGLQAGIDSCAIRRSLDDGLTWQIVNTLPNKISADPDPIGHIHAIEYDPYEKMFWVLIGDGNTQPRIYKTKNGEELILVGKSYSTTDFWNEGQLWRAVSAVFHEDYVLWGMDGGFPGAWIIRYDRKTEETTLIHHTDGYMFYALSIELSWSTKNKASVFSQSANPNANMYFTLDGYNVYQPINLISNDFHLWFCGPSRMNPVIDEFWISNRVDILAPEYSSEPFRSAKIRITRM